MINIKRACILLGLAAMLGVSGCGGGGGGGGTSVPSASTATEGTSGSAPASAAEAPTPSSTGVAKLSWDAATSGDGEIAGYKVCYGTVSGTYSKTVDVGAATTCTIDNLPKGKYFFAVTAYDRGGSESTYSNEVSKDI